MTDLAVVAIGRNEGDRLVRCLASVPAGVSCVYVDSGSTDGSVAAARRAGATVVELDLRTPFTAARARNAGLRAVPTAARFVQFIDGDCEFADGWLVTARQRLLAEPGLTAVAGRLRERFPMASVYNRLCDLEWDTPAGPCDAVGGIALVRRDALEGVGGFRESLIAGEEPELCSRMRNRGGRVERLAAEMAVHDAAMTRFGQWWRRAVRAGYAYAEVSTLTRRTAAPIWAREVRGILAWGVVLPVGVAVLSLLTGWAALALGLYPLLMIKTYRTARSRWPARQAALYAGFCVLAKFPQVVGVWRYWLGRVVHRPAGILEYKRPAAIPRAMP